MELTEDGANYLPSLREAFALIASGTQAFIGGDRGRNMTLQCNMAFSVFWLAPRLRRLYAKYPWLVLNIVTPIWDPERHAANASVEIRFGRGGDMSAAAVRLAKERFFPVCAPDYLGDAIDLNSATLFDCAGITGTWESWFKTQGNEFNRDGEVNLTSTFVIAVTAALNGAGISMAHDSLVSGMLEQGELVRPFAHTAPLSEGYFPHFSVPACPDPGIRCIFGLDRRRDVKLEPYPVTSGQTGLTPGGSCRDGLGPVSDHVRRCGPLRWPRVSSTIQVPFEDIQHTREFATVANVVRMKWQNGARDRRNYRSHYGRKGDSVFAEHYGLVSAVKIVKRAGRETVSRGSTLWVVLEEDVDSGLPVDWCSVYDLAARSAKSE